jgi:hypothetical protein
MSTPVGTRTFPYHPGEPFTQDEIWGGTSPGAPDYPISGQSGESKRRWDEVLKQGAVDLIDSLKQRLIPEPSPAEKFRKGALPDDVYMDENGELHLRISAPAAQPKPPAMSNVALIGIGVLGLLLIVGIAKDTR